MDRFLDINLMIHIGAGSLALACFWTQIFSRKGSPLHIISGRLFIASGLLITGAAAFSIILRTYRAYGEGITPFTHPDDFQVGAILLYISVMVSVFLWTGSVLARYQARPADLPLPGLLVRAFIAVTATSSLAAYAWLLRPELWHVILGISVLGTNATWDQVKLLFRRAPNSTARLAEHITNMFGAGLAFHVAFILLGSERFVDIWQWGIELPMAIIAVVIVGGITAEKLFRRRLLQKASASS